MPKKKKHGKFIMLDGIDGSGKGTIVKMFKRFLLCHGHSVFSVDDFCKKHHDFPESGDFRKAEVIFTSEPTYSMIGQAIRGEIIKDNNRHYSALTAAEAFALDRKILYKRIVIPALLAGKSVIQERGISTSLIYQPIQKEKLSLNKIMNLRGNKLALRYAPDLLIIAEVSPSVALMRTKNRAKKDEAIFEKAAFLSKAARRFKAPWFRNIFENRGTDVVYLNTEKAPRVTQQEAIKIIENFF